MPKNKVASPNKILDLRYAPYNRGSCAAKMFEINKPKAKTLTFEDEPKSDFLFS